VSDYAASAEIAAGRFTLAAESLAHSVPVSRGGVLFAENHIVIEVAFFAPSHEGPSHQIVAFEPEQFTLRVNRKQPEILPDSPGAVAAGMRDSIFSAGPNLQASGSVGDAGVILGRRRSQTGIPDLDRVPGQRPPLPRAPEQPDRSGNSPPQPLDIDQELQRASLSRGEFRLPTAGLLYFPYRGKLKSIKHMVLRYHPPGRAPVELTLVP
jgi:hypothetical protein